MTEVRARLFAFALFMLALLAVAVGEKYFHVIHRAYWIDHGFFGFGFTLLVFSLTGLRWVACLLTLTWSFGNELLQDPLDRLAANPNVSYYVQWSHIGGDLLGFAVACILLWLPLRIRRQQHVSRG